MTVRVAVAVLFAASRAVTVTMLEPGCRVIPPVTDHVEVPAAVPLPPRSLAHVTWVMLMLSPAVPLSGIGLVPVA